jgi:hypothetical protein
MEKKESSIVDIGIVQRNNLIMNTIYAILNKPKGRGSDRRWEAFKIQGEKLCQADVEDFMIRTHHSTSQYFLSTGKEFIEDGYLLKRNEKGKKLIPWVNFEDVFFEWKEGLRKFTIKDFISFPSSKL